MKRKIRRYRNNLEHIPNQIERQVTLDDTNVVNEPQAVLIRMLIPVVAGSNLLPGLEICVGDFGAPGDSVVDVLTVAVPAPGDIIVGVLEEPRHRTGETVARS